MILVKTNPQFKNQMKSEEKCSSDAMPLYWYRVSESLPNNRMYIVLRLPTRRIYFRKNRVIKNPLAMGATGRNSNR